MPRPGRSRTRACSISTRRAGISPSPVDTSSPQRAQTQTQAQALDDLCCPIPEKSTDVNCNPNECHDYVEQGQGIMRSNASIIVTTFANPCTPNIRRACLPPSATVVTDNGTSTSSNTSTRSTSSSDDNDAEDLDTAYDLDDLDTSCLSRRSRNTLNTALNTSMSASCSSRRSRQKSSVRSPERGRQKRLERVNESFPSSTCDLVVRVGQKNFYHSSAVLGYASDYLKSQLQLEKQKQPRGSYYHIDFSHHQPEQWQVVLEYFQPRSLGVKQLTWKQVPIVLPWFTQFGLKVLLYDIDTFLLETVVTQCQGELTLDNVLLLARISFECSLVTTQSQARQWLKASLLDPRYKNKSSSSSSSSVEGEEQENQMDNNIHNDNDVGSVLAWSLADLQLLSSLLTEFDSLREYLWESSMIQFLPHDLAVNDSKTLTKNPLFPYLLREGMMQLCVVERAQLLIEKTRALLAETELLEVNSLLDIKRNHSNCDSNNSIMTPLQELWSQEMLHGLLQGVVEHLDAFALENEQVSKRTTLSRENRRTKSRKASSRSQSQSKQHGPQNDDDNTLVADMNGNIISPPSVESGSDTCSFPERSPVRVPASVAPSWDGGPANDHILFEREIDPTMYMYNQDFATMSMTPITNPPAPRSHRTFEC